MKKYLTVINSHSISTMSSMSSGSLWQILVAGRRLAERPSTPRKRLLHTHMYEFSMSECTEENYNF